MTNSTRRRSSAAAGIAGSAITATCLLSAAPLAAQEGPSPYTLGLGLRYAPEYQGSADMEARVLPFVSLNYGIVILGPEQISLNWRPGGAAGRAAGGGAGGPGYQGLTISGYVGYGGARDAADMDLAGFDDIDASARIGLRATYVMGYVDVFGSAERYLGGSEGTTMTFGAGTRLAVSDRLSLRFSLSTTFADETYMDAYFGVTPEQAALNSVAVYDASSGFQRYDVTMTARYRVDRNWSLLGQLRYGGLADMLSDSAVVEEDTSMTSMVAVLYSF